MKRIIGLLVAAMVVVLAGCSAKDQPTKSWKEGPYHKVIASTDLYGSDYTETWVRGEPGDQLVRETVFSKFSKRHITGCVYVVRKDKTRFILPMLVHDQDDRYRVEIIHVVDKNDREIEFLKL